MMDSPGQRSIYEVNFAWSDNGRFYYQVATIGHAERSFIVWIQVSESAAEHRDAISKYQRAIEKWCRLNLEHLPAHGETKQVSLEGIPLRHVEGPGARDADY
jgi:hypothetical protein